MCSATGFGDVAALVIPKKSYGHALVLAQLLSASAVPRLFSGSFRNLDQSESDYNLARSAESPRAALGRCQAAQQPSSTLGTRGAGGCGRFPKFRFELWSFRRFRGHGSSWLKVASQARTPFKGPEDPQNASERLGRRVPHLFADLRCKPIFGGSYFREYPCAVDIYIYIYIYFDLLIWICLFIYT